MVTDHGKGGLHAECDGEPKQEPLGEKLLPYLLGLGERERKERAGSAHGRDWIQILAI